MRRSSFIDKMQFINNAVSTDETRYFMNRPYFDAEKSRIMSTDGRRAHIWNLSTYELERFKLSVSGYIKLLPKEHMAIPMPMEGQFPNIDKVVPELTPAKLRIDMTRGFDIMNDGPIFTKRTGIILNLKYLNDIKGCEWSASYGNTDRAIRFDCVTEGLVAVIMPMAHDAEGNITMLEVEAAAVAA